jgi:hypothetical protein
VTRRRKRNIIIASIVATVLLVSGAYLIYPYTLEPVVQQLRGNHRIDFYGRVVDEQGNGVGSVVVVFHITYSDGNNKPGMFGRNESFKYYRCLTGPDGLFQLSRRYGYALGIHEVWWKGDRVGLLGVSVPKSDDAAYGVLMDNVASRRRLPDTPEKRLSYRIVPLD